MTTPPRAAGRTGLPRPGLRAPGPHAGPHQAAASIAEAPRGGRLRHRPGPPRARLQSLDAEVDGLAFGRLDEEDGDTWYVGRRHVEDDARRPRRRRLAGAGRRRPSTGPPRADPLGLRRRRRFVMTARQLDDLFDEVFDDPDSVDAAAPRRHPRPAARRARALPHRRDARHRRHHRGRAGRRDPRAARHLPRRAGRARHRQDGGRPPPRRLPPLRAPRACSTATACWWSGPTRRSSLHRAGAPVARRDGDPPDHRRAPGGRSGRSRATRPTWRASRATLAWRRVLRRRSPPSPATARRGPGGGHRRGGACGSGRRPRGRPSRRSSRATSRSRRGATPSAPGCAGSRGSVTRSRSGRTPRRAPPSTPRCAPTPRSTRPWPGSGRPCRRPCW